MANIKKELGAILQDVEKGFGFVDKEVPVVELPVQAIVAILDPSATPVVAAAFKTLGTLLTEIQQTGSAGQAAVGAKGLSVPFDQAFIEDAKALIATSKEILVSLGILKAASVPGAPAGPAAPATSS